MALFTNQATLTYNGSTTNSNIAYGELLDVLVIKQRQEVVYMTEISSSEKGTRKAFSRIGIALCAIFLVSSLLQVVWFQVLDLIPGMPDWFTTSSWGIWMGTFIPMYLIGIPVGLLIVKGVPGETPEENRLGSKDFFKFLLIAFFLMYAGNILGTMLSGLLSGGQAQNVLDEYAMDTNPLKIVFMVIGAPLIEEYIFRKCLLDKTRKYGEKAAVFLSALTFGLFHMNLFQFFYAFALGWLFAYIYLRTGRLRYPILFHGIINFMGGVVAPAILSLVDSDALTNMDANTTIVDLISQYRDMLPGLIATMLYSYAMIGLAIAGLVLLILERKKMVWRETQYQLPKDRVIKTIYINFGMIAFILLSLAFTLLSVM